MDISIEELNALKQIDINTVDINSLVDIKDIKIDMTLSYQQRLRQFFEQIQNPYCFKCGDIVLKLEFNEEGETLEDLVKSYLTYRNDSQKD